MSDVVEDFRKCLCMTAGDKVFGSFGELSNHIIESGCSYLVDAMELSNMPIFTRAGVVLKKKSVLESDFHSYIGPFYPISKDPEFNRLGIHFMFKRSG